MRSGRFLIVLLLIGALVVGIVYAPTKIVPTDGAEPGHPFTILDTPAGRLVDGCQAVFNLGGSQTTIDLRTHRPYKTAKGEIPADMGGGDYQVSIRCPDSTEFEIGTFMVIGEITPFIITSDYIELDKIAQISKFRSGAGHDHSDSFETCRSMKHYFKPKDGVDASQIKIFSPVDGTVHKITEGWAGSLIEILSGDYFILIFHVNLLDNIGVGSTFTEGQHIGYHIGSQTWSDIAVLTVVEPDVSYKFISYFEYMDDSVFQNYVNRGATSREDFIISKEERDADPLICDGSTFLTQGNLENWFYLN
jgi:hypothetical protein